MKHLSRNSVPWKTLLPTVWRTRASHCRSSPRPVALHAWSHKGTFLVSLMVEFPVNFISNISRYFKISHSHTDPRLGPQAGTENCLSSCLCCAVLQHRKRQWIWTQRAQSSELHAPPLNSRKDFLTPSLGFHILTVGRLTEATCSWALSTEG